MMGLVQVGCESGTGLVHPGVTAVRADVVVKALDNVLGHRVSPFAVEVSVY